MIEITHYHVPLEPKTMNKLKKVLGTTQSKRALEMAVEHTLNTYKQVVL